MQKENQRNAVKIDEKVGENKEKLGFVIRQYLFLSMRLKDEENKYMWVTGNYFFVFYFNYLKFLRFKNDVILFYWTN